jgi:hypothetical protein
VVCEDEGIIMQLVEAGVYYHEGPPRGIILPVGEYTYLRDGVRYVARTQRDGSMWMTSTKKAIAVPH